MRKSMGKKKKNTHIKTKIYRKQRDKTKTPSPPTQYAFIMYIIKSLVKRYL